VKDALRVTDDRPSHWRLLTGCRNGLEETRLGGFFVVRPIGAIGSGVYRTSAARKKQMLVMGGFQEGTDCMAF